MIFPLVSAFNHSFAIDVTINFIAYNLANVSMTINLFIFLFRLEVLRTLVRKDAKYFKKMKFIADWIKSNNDAEQTPRNNKHAQHE